MREGTGPGQMRRDEELRRRFSVDKRAISPGVGYQFLLRRFALFETQRTGQTTIAE